MLEGIKKFQKVLDILKKVYPELPLQQIDLFVKVALTEGITMQELATLTQMPQGNLSRNIKALSLYLKDDLENYPNRILAGHDLLQRRPDLYNSKRLAVFLSENGKKVIKQIEEALE